MNERLEDIIRRSADEQAKRYRPSSDLAARVEHRRRQRAARRMTAAGVGMAAIVGIIGFAATRQTGPTDLGVAESTTSLLPTTTAVRPSTPTSTTPTALPSSTAPGATAPQAGAPPTTAPPLNPATPPPYPAAGGTVWPYGQFWNVPQLGNEGSVRGTGCGSAGGMGNVIPDGLFAGFVTGHDDNNVSIDVLCVFAVPDASALPSDGATVVADTPNYVIVNNNTRARTMPMDPAIVLRLGIRDAADNCVDGTPTDQWSDITSDRQAWVRIHQGRVTWVFADC